MKILIIGGTGLISSACSDLAVARGHELWIVNRSTSRHYSAPEAATVLQADVYAEEARLSSLLADHRFDAVVDFLAYTVQDIERDLRLFRGKTGQFVFIGSTSAYQKPPKHYLITEETPLENPYWGYSRSKIACEERLMKAYKEEGFPVTIVDLWNVANSTCRGKLVTSLHSRGSNETSTKSLYPGRWDFPLGTYLEY